MNTKNTIEPSGTMPAYVVEGRRTSCGERVYYTERGTQAGAIVPYNWDRAERYGCPADAQATRDKLAERFRGITWTVIDAHTGKPY